MFKVTKKSVSELTTGELDTVMGKIMAIRHSTTDRTVKHMRAMDAWLIVNDEMHNRASSEELTIDFNPLP